MNQKSNHLFVINTHAGSQIIDWKKEIELFFAAKNVEPSFFILPKQIVLKELKAYIENSPAENIIVVGGDGTVSMIAGMILHSKKQMGIIPAGSANGMARELGIPMEPAAAMEMLETGIVQNCDSILINQKHICLHLSDIGLNAQLIKYFDEGKLRGKWGYTRMIFKTLWYREKMHVRFKTMDAQINIEAVMLVIANASQYGTGAVINPDGSFDDGLFELVLVKKLSVRSLLTMLLKPGPFNPKHIEIFHCKSVAITTKHRVHFQIDGEYMGKIKSIQAEILPHSLHIILPAKK